MPAEEYYNKLAEMGKKHGFDIRFHPARGYYFDKATGNYEKKPEHSLERIAASVLIGFAFMFLLMKLPIMTGFVTSNTVSNNFKPAIFMVAGLLLSLAIYMIIKKRTKLK
jgi:hypothetical protein